MFKHIIALNSPISTYIYIDLGGMKSDSPEWIAASGKKPFKLDASTQTGTRGLPLVVAIQYLFFNIREKRRCYIHRERERGRRSNKFYIAAVLICIIYTHIHT